LLKESNKHISKYIDPGNITENIILSTSNLNAKIIGKKINK